MKKLLIMLISSIIALPMMAFDDNDYQKFVQEVKKEVWAKDLPQFNTRTVPTQYKNESAVVLALYEEFSVNQSKRFNFINVTNIKAHTSIHLKRYLIKINDKAALEKFSTFDFRTYDRSLNDALLHEDHRTVLGVKVIKPNGTVKEVSSDEYQEANEGKKGKEKRTKLAVPDLQVGDLIDYFTYDFDKVKEENIDPALFVFGADYPILDYQIHCSIDKQLCTQYRTMNGAPDFTASQKDDDIVLDVREKNIDKTLPDYAYNAIAQAPYIMLYATANVALDYTAKSTKEKGLHANPDASVIQDDAWTCWWDYNTKWTPGKLLAKVVKAAQKLGSDEEKADYIYNYMVMNSLVFKRPYEEPYTFSTLFTSMLDKLKVPYLRALTTNTSLEPFDKLINYSDATRFIMLKNGRCYFPLGYAVAAGVVPSPYLNRDAVSTDRPKKFNKGPFTSFKTPASNAAENVESVTINAAVDGVMLNIERQNSYTGCEKEGMIPNLTTAEELCKAWGTAYNMPNFSDFFVLKKSETDTKVAERAEQDKKDVAEAFADEIKAYHDKTPVKINQTKVTGFGQNNTPFTYTTSYQVDGLVKKAGRNIVVSIGQLFGQQTHIEGKERERNADIMYSNPRTYSVSLSLAIPQGYTVAAESLEKLNNNIDNENVGLSTKAEISSDKLVISFQKTYKKLRIPAANWPQVLDMLDRAYDFTNQQIILKKL